MSPVQCRTRISCLCSSAAFERLVEKSVAQGPRGDRRLRGLVRSGAALDPGTEKNRILKALDELEAGGSTNGAEGIQLAYQTARENFIKGGNNRVILCTDGDFNVGVTSHSELISLIEKERGRRVPLRPRLRHGQPQRLDDGNCRQRERQLRLHRFVTERRKVLVEQMGGTLVRRSPRM